MQITNRSQLNLVITNLEGLTPEEQILEPNQTISFNNRTVKRVEFSIRAGGIFDVVAEAEGVGSANVDLVAGGDRADDDSGVDD